MISDVLVRAAILRRVPQQALIDFVLRKIKPHMGHDEVLHFDLDAEVITEERGL